MVESTRVLISFSTLSFSSFAVLAVSFENSIFKGLQYLVEDGRGFCQIVLPLQINFSGTIDVMKTAESLASKP